MSLKTNYKDAVFPGARKYREVSNDDGTKSFTDATTYTQEGDRFGAKDINETNEEINALEAVRTATLPASGWSSSVPYTQTVSVTGVKNTDKPIIGIYFKGTESAVTVKAMNKAYGFVDRIETQDGSIKAYCYNKKPTVDFSIQLKGV